MKIFVIGIGQCGSNIADEFYAINKYSKSIFGRGIEIVTNAIAINTDETDLGSFRNIPNDRHHRILIGAIRAFGHGVGKVNAEAARIIKESQTFLTDNILNAKKFYESDAVLVIASGGGGTGSGSIGWVCKMLKERIDRPVYAIVVLPFEYEERGETSYAVTNTATCVKTVLQYADAVFLLDNERFGKTDSSLAVNLRDMNRQMVGNFYDLFCAGEEKRHKYVGSKVIDAGDIKQSLEGITTIGRGVVPLSAFRFRSKDHFREGMKESSIIAEALSQAVNNLCLSVDLEDARKILALIGAPRDAVTLTALEEIATYLEDRSPKAVVRIGDYPRRTGEVSVTLMVSKLTRVERLESIYRRAEELLKHQEEIERESEMKIRALYETAKNIPSLE